MKHSFTILLSVGVMTAMLAAPPEDRFYDSDGVRLRYAENGAGEPVLLVHGLTRSVEADRLALGLIDDLGRDHRVIAFDCRGHGRSNKPHVPKGYGVEMVRDVARLLDDLGVRRAHVVGYSLGARITLRAVVEHLGRFHGVTLAAGAGQIGWTQANADRAEQEASELERGEMRSLVRRLAPRDRPEPSEDALPQIAATLLAGQALRALAAVHRSHNELAVTADPARLDLERLKRLQPSLELVVIDDASRMAWPTTARQQRVAAIRSFLAAHRAVRTGAVRNAEPPSTLQLIGRSPLTCL